MVDSHAKLIDDLGGAAKLRRALQFSYDADLTAQAISKWKAQGVPWRWRMPLSEMAKRRKIAVPDNFLTPTGD